MTTAAWMVMVAILEQYHKWTLDTSLCGKMMVKIPHLVWKHMVA